MPCSFLAKIAYCPTRWMQPAPSREYHFPQKVECAAWWPRAELWGKALLSRHWIWNNMHPVPATPISTALILHCCMDTSLTTRLLGRGP